jgi:arabinan endo-1,5-alpha-L-arabinosidase
MQPFNASSAETAVVMFRNISFVRLHLFVLLLLISSSAIQADEPDPVLRGCPDPAIIEADDGWFYIFSTGAGLPIIRSKNLVHWVSVGRVFPNKRVPDWAREAVPGTKGIWAPDVSYFNDLFHVYYSISTFGSQRSAIGLAVNKTLDPESSDYEWIDRGMVIDSTPPQRRSRGEEANQEEGDDFNAIDPAIFIDSDGSVYMFWGSYWNGIKAVEIDPETGKPYSGVSRLDIASRWGFAAPPAIEGAYVVEQGDGYCLFVSFDACCDGADSTYKVMVGRADHPLGPYMDVSGNPMMDGAGTLLLANHGHWRGPGHNSVLRTETQDFLVHHTYDMVRMEQQRVLQIRPIYWLDDGWPVVGEPLTKDRTIEAFCNSSSEVDFNPIGVWRHSVDYLEEETDRTIELREDGAIYSVLRPDVEIIFRLGRWEIEENLLKLRWPSSDAPDGEWIDIVILESDRASYIGRNQFGQIIRGVRQER